MYVVKLGGRLEDGDFLFFYKYSFGCFGFRDVYNETATTPDLATILFSSLFCHPPLHCRFLRLLRSFFCRSRFVYACSKK